MARGRNRKKSEDHENHERWLVSYADFITLLFAFFVVMYAISTVNEGKYRVLSDTMVEAFSDELLEEKQTKLPLLSDQRQPGEYLDRGDQSEIPSGEQQAGETPQATVEPSEETERIPSDVPANDDRLWVVASNLDSSLQGFVDQGLVNINLQGDKIEIQLSSRMLFGSGSTRLSREARDAFSDIATIVKPLNNTIFVEGHTDNVPIKTLAFPSNWELSAARAASVVEYLVRQGVNPSRMAAIGYGEHRPISTNDTDEGRSQNRRVTLVLRSAPGATNPYAELGVDSVLPDQGDTPWAESPGGL